ncbi:HipA N-terminal domain-containing protein [Citricoccus sp. NPDC079358]|uniref:HipA N-terminal domain-containing protein n=1 Tax=Citricoccus sp. NPDC079358 TaxID=3154653 RepID=UPI00344D0274
MAPHVETVEVFCGTRQAGSMGVESDPVCPLEHVTFTYHPDWLDDGFTLSPDLPLRRGPQRPRLGRELFASFEDAAPDSWGRKLLFERLRLQAVESGTHVPRLTAARGLLMVNDDTRQGALRFRQHGGSCPIGQIPQDLRPGGCAPLGDGGHPPAILRRHHRATIQTDATG